MTWHEVERAALVDALLAVPYDAPTLCEGWQARHLAAHVVLREHSPAVGLELAVPRLNVRSDAAVEKRAALVTDDASYAELVDEVAHGAPAWHPGRWAGDLTNVTEFYVHTEDVRRGAGPVPPRALEPGLVDALWRQVRGERGRERGRDAFEDELLGTQTFLDFVAAWWPPLDAREVLGWLRDGEMLARVAEGTLSHDEQQLLHKSWGDTLSIDDIPLLDELRYALGDVPEITADTHDDELGIDISELQTVAEREFASGPAWKPPSYRIDDDPYAHVLIDEAQDLTPMQWRMVGRRGRTASWTIVGDPAQSSWPAPEEAAAARAQALEGKAIHEFHLGTNYRNSSEIYAFAAAYAERVGLNADLPTAVRSTGEHPVVIDGADDLEAMTREVVRDLASRVSGTVGIVVPVARRADVNAWLASWPEFAGDAPGASAAARDSDAIPSGEDRIVVLTGLDTKGLEFDAIAVLCPQEIEDESPTGKATLYVVLTRATQLLTTIS